MDLPLWRQLPPSVVVGMGAIALISAVVIALLWMSSPAVPDAASVTYCRDLYRHAQNVADSAAVDATYPIDRGVVSQDRIRCGALRTEGRLE